MQMSKKQQPNPYPLHRTLPVISGAAAIEPKPILPVAKQKSFAWKQALVVFVILSFIAVLFVGVWDWQNFSSATNKLFGTPNFFSLLNTSSVGGPNDRVNILLVGYSADDPGHAGANLTDSIMILSLDKQTKTGYMLSVPRDLYVNIPGYGHAKINEAYQDGGMSLLEKVISDSLGIQVQRYAIFDYAAVKQIVDALGGITVTIKSPDPRGIYDPNFKPQEGGPLKLANGLQKLDGQTALRLTRARGSTYGSYGFPQSDFNRTKDQQLVLTSIKSKLSWTLVLDPRTNGRIFTAIANNVKTDVDISEVLPLYRLFNSVPTSSLQTVALNNINGVNLLRGYTTPNGEAALIPTSGIDRFGQIQETLSQLGF